MLSDVRDHSQHMTALRKLLWSVDHDVKEPAMRGQNIVNETLPLPPRKIGFHNNEQIDVAVCRSPAVGAAAKQDHLFRLRSINNALNTIANEGIVDDWNW